MQIVFFLLFSSFLCAKPFKVATYNVENLFDTTYKGKEYKSYSPHTSNWSKEMLEIKLNHIAEVICDIEADIIGLQEIENEAILKVLFKRLEEVGCAYSDYAITNKKDSVMQVALLSRYPITKSRDIFVHRTLRNILEVEVMIDKNPLILFVNHWKSRAYHGVESWRIKEAKALQDTIAKLFSTQAYIILGDLNSEYNNYLFLEKKLDDTKGMTAFNDILRTYENNFMIEENQMQNLSRGKHYSLWLELDIKERWSYKFYGTKSTPDHIVLPSSLFDGKGIDYVNNSFSVMKYDYLFHKKGYINRWQIKKNIHEGKGYSDHLPISAFFDTKPYVKEKASSYSQIAKIKPIEFFYNISKLHHPIILKDVLVVFKRRNHAIIKQSAKGRGIYLYHCAKHLKEGQVYDLRIESMNEYYGLKEITRAYIFKEKGLKNPHDYYALQKDLIKNRLEQNEVVKNIIGIVDKGFLLIEHFKLPIHFKKKKYKPKNGSKIKIFYAHLGYDNGLKLLVYNKKDFIVLEK